MKNKKNERGMLIVEASIVFPVMFLVIFLMIFAGNAYFQKCRVEAIVNQMAVDGAAMCADPLLDKVQSGEIPGHENVQLFPYRYLVGGMSDVETIIENNINNKIRNLSTGLFSNMKPSSASVEVEYNNGFIYSTFSVQADYKIEIPVRLLGESDFIAMNISSRADMPVSDTPEFIRNIDMVEDYLESTGVKGKIEEAVGKAKEWLS